MTERLLGVVGRGDPDSSRAASLGDRNEPSEDSDPFDRFRIFVRRTVPFVERLPEDECLASPEHMPWKGLLGARDSTYAMFERGRE